MKNLEEKSRCILLGSILSDIVADVMSVLTEYEVGKSADVRLAQIKASTNALIEHIQAVFELRRNSRE